MNFSILFALFLAVCCTSEATFFRVGGRHKKKNGLFGGYLADIGGAFLRYAPDFYDVIPKQVTKFLGGHKKHKHHNEYEDDYHHHHHQKKHHHHHAGHDGHDYGHYFDSAAYYGFAPHHYHYGVPHHDAFYPEFHDFNDITPYGVHSGYGLDSFDHHFDHFY